MSWKKKFKSALKKFKKADPLLGKVIERSAVYKDNGEFDFKQSLTKHKIKTDLLADKNTGQDPLEKKLGLTPATGFGKMPKSEADIQAAKDDKEMQRVWSENLSFDPASLKNMNSVHQPLQATDGSNVYNPLGRASNDYKGILSRKARKI